MGKEDKGQNKRMCEIKPKKHLDVVKELAKNAQYVCRSCGRAAASKQHLCKPEKA
jgi:hypothetical protein